MKLKHLLLAMIASSSFLSIKDVEAQLCYNDVTGFPTYTQSLNNLNTNTGSVSLIGSIPSSTDSFTGFAFAPSGTVYVNGSGGNNIYSISGGNVSLLWGGGALQNPDCIALNTNGQIFSSFIGGIAEVTVTDTSTNAGDFITGLNVTGLAFNAGGILFASSTNSILEIGTNGNILSTFATLSTNASTLAFDKSGDLFAGCNGNGTIYEITPDGSVNTFASGFADPLSSIAFDFSGNLFAATTASSIYEITPNGTVSTFTNIPNIGAERYIAFSNATLPVPEPSTYAFLGLGMLTVLLAVRRKA